MNNFSLISVLFIFLLLIGCNTSNSSIIKVHTIQSRVLEIDSGFFGNPNKLLLIDSLMLFEDEIDGNFFAAIDLKNKKFIKRFGRKGNGPNEIITPASLFIYKGDFAFNTMNSFDLASFEVSDITNNPNPKTTIIGELNTKKNESIYSYMVPLKNDGYFLSTGFYKNGKYAFIDLNKKKDSIFGKYNIDYKDIDQFNHGILLQSVLAHHPTERKIVNIGVSQDLLEILSYNEMGQFELFSNNPTHISEINTDSNGPKLSRSNKLAFLNFSVTEKYIYLLYSGKSFDEYGMGFAVSDEIQVYDWSLKMIATYKLDQAISSFIVSPDDKHLYSFALIEDIELLQWRLPE